MPTSSISYMMDYTKDLLICQAFFELFPELSNNTEQTITGSGNRLNRTIIIKPFYSHINGLTYRFELILLTTASL